MTTFRHRSGALGALTRSNRQTYSCIPIDCMLATQLKTVKQAVGRFDAAFENAIR